MVAEVACGVLAHGLKNADDVQVLALVASGQDGAAVDINGGHIGAQHAHHAAGHVFVAAADHHHAVHPLALHTGLNAVRNHLAAHQAVFHALGAHGHAVRDGGRAKHLGVAARFFNAGNGRVGQLLQAAVAWRDGAVAVGHTDHGLFEVRLLVAHGVVHRPVGRAGLAFGNVGAAVVDGLDGDDFFGHGLWGMGCGQKEILRPGAGALARGVSSTQFCGMPLVQCAASQAATAQETSAWSSQKTFFGP